MRRAIGVLAGILLAFASLNASAQPDFSDPIRVNSPDSQRSSGIDLATGSEGRVVAVWSELNGNNFDVHSSVSDDEGLTWSTSTVLSTGNLAALNEGDASVATDGMGNWVTVWTSDLTLAGVVRASTSYDNGMTWTTAVSIDEQEFVFPVGAEVETDGQGNWVVAWLEFNNSTNFRDILISRSANNGASWSAPEVFLDDEYAHHVQICSDKNDVLIVVWTLYTDSTFDDSDLYFSRSIDGGATWSAPQILTAASGTARNTNPSIATDETGTWMVAWSAADDPTTAVDEDIVVMRSDDDGITWTDPEFLSTGANAVDTTDFRPAIASNRFGNWLAAWTTDSDGPLEDFEDLDLSVAESADNGLSWSMATALNTTAAIDAAYDDDTSVHVIASSDGTWMAGWVLTLADRPPGHLILEPSILVATAPTASPGSNGGSSGGCFIATAAYGTPMTAELDRLRDFRDQRLLGSSAGSAFVDAYYRISPTAANWIAPRPMMRAAVRAGLQPIAGERPVTGVIAFVAAVVTILAALRMRRA